MLEIELQEIIRPNKEIVELIGARLLELNDGGIRHIKRTNIKHILLVQYIVKFDTETILINEYKGKFKGDRTFYISILKQSYTLKEIKQLLKERN